METAKLVTAKVFSNQLEAELAKSALQSADIPAVVQADSCGGQESPIAWAGRGFRVLVPEEDAATAHEILDPR